MRLKHGEVFVLQPFETFHKGEPVTELESMHDITQETLTFEGYSEGDLIEINVGDVKGPTSQSLKMAAIQYIKEEEDLKDDEMNIGEWERLEAANGEEHYFLPINVDSRNFMYVDNMLYVKLVIKN